MEAIKESVFHVMGEAIEFIYQFEPLAQKSVFLGKRIGIFAVYNS